MSNTSVKEDGVFSKTFSITVEQKDLYDLNESIRHRIVETLASDYIAEYGDKIIEIVSPESVAEQIRHHIGKVFWKDKQS